MLFNSKPSVTTATHCYSLVLFMDMACLGDARLDLGYHILFIHLSKCNNADILYTGSRLRDHLMLPLTFPF
jgi:hypothetical protein